MQEWSEAIHGLFGDSIVVRRTLDLARSSPDVLLESGGATDLHIVVAELISESVPRRLGDSL